jgi:hypothetical protein
MLLMCRLVIINEKYRLAYKSFSLSSKKYIEKIFRAKKLRKGGGLNIKMKYKLKAMSPVKL